MKMYYNESESLKNKEPNIYHEFMLSNENGELDTLLETIKYRANKISYKLDTIAKYLDNINDELTDHYNLSSDLFNEKIKCYKLSDDLTYEYRKIITYLNNSINAIEKDSKKTLNIINESTRTIERSI